MGESQPHWAGALHFRLDFLALKDLQKDADAT